MADALIENPIVNSPYEEPRRHWAFLEIKDPWQDAEGEIRRLLRFPQIAYGLTHRTMQLNIEAPEPT